MPYKLSPSQVEGLGETALAPQVPTNLNYKLGSHEVFTNPYKGTKHTVENMIRLVKESQGDMVLRRFVENLCRGLRPKDYISEAAAIYFWSCKNLRYMRDPRLVEMLKSPRYILENYKVGGVDCLPEGTLLVTQGYKLTPIEDLNVGDEILGGKGWTKITNFWDKDAQSILSFELNNGCVLRCTPNHKVFRINRESHGTYKSEVNPRRFVDTVEEIRANDVRPGDYLLQPDKIPFGLEHVDSDKALILGAYVAEGWLLKAGVAIAGIADSKGLRERVIEAANNCNFNYSECERWVSLWGVKIRDWLEPCGHPARNKQFPSIDVNEQTAEMFLSGVEHGDGGVSEAGTMVFSTTSSTLAIQHRLIHRMFGRSTHIKKVDDHGGLGTHPIYRCTVRRNDVSRKSKRCKVEAISDGGTLRVYDIETENHSIYLPECDLVVHNCDDLAVWISSCCSIAGMPVRFITVGFKPRALTIRPVYTHVFASAQDVKSNKWMVLDPVAGPRTEAMLKSVKQAAIYDVG